MENKQWALRYTPERVALIERLRAKLEQVNRKVSRLHGTITDAAILEQGLQALERELDQEITNKD